MLFTRQKPRVKPGFPCFPENQLIYNIWKPPKPITPKLNEVAPWLLASGDREELGISVHVGPQLGSQPARLSRRVRMEMERCMGRYRSTDSKDLENTCMADDIAYRA